MKTDHLTRLEVEGYRGGTLPAAALLVADDHLAECEECRERVAAIEATAAGLASALRAELGRELDEGHASYEDLAAFVDGTAGPAERARLGAHVADCPACASELADLEELATRLRDHPAPPPPAPTRVVIRREAGRWQRSSGSPAMQIAVAAGVLLVAALGAFYLTRDRPVASEQARVPPSVEHSSPSARTDEADVADAAALPDAVVTLADAGGFVVLDGDGNIHGIALDASENELVRDALESGHPAVDPAVHDLLAARGTLMSGDSDPESFALLAPIATAVADDRPVFRWDALAGASRYRVEVFDAGYNLVASSGPLTATLWPSDQDLPRGMTYSWQVIATVGGDEIRSPLPPTPEARFFVLDAEAAGSVEKQVARHAKSHLVRGLLYARAGLLENAETELRALRQANPDSPVAAELLERLRPRPSTP